MTFIGFLIKNLLRRKARTLLTIIGVAVAMSTIVTLRGVARGFETSFQQNFEHRRADLIVTAAGVPDQLRSDLDERLGPRIAALSGVQKVTAGLVELVDVQRGDGTISAMIHGWVVNGTQFEDLNIMAGRTLKEGDRRKILLGTTLASHLRKNAGDLVELQRQKFEVVGLFQSFSVFENGGAVVPLAELQELMQRKNSVTGFSVVLDPAPDKRRQIDEMRPRIEALTDDEGVQYRITAQPTREYVRNSMPIRMANGMAWVTSFIALVIGAISMLNTMIMSVLERTKEIGVLRAIGWRKRRVVGMVLGEALLLSLAAMGLGTVVAFVVLRWLASLPQTSGFVAGDLSPLVLLECLGITLVLAVLGGGYPAFRAAGWLPSEALRYE